MSLRWRLVAVFAVLGAVAIGAATLSAWVTTSRELRSEVDDFLLQRGADVAEGRRTLPGPGGGDPGAGGPGAGGPGPVGPPGAPATFAPDLSTQVIDEDGEVTAAFGTELPVDEGDRAVAAAGPGADARLRTVEVDGVPYRVLTLPLATGGAAQLARDVTETEDVIDALAGRLVLITLTGAAIFGLVGGLVARRLTGPVQALAAAAEEVAATQDLSIEIPGQGHDEVGRLARSFTTMLAALGDSRRRQQQLVQDASHELRTPLTSLRTSAELLERAGDLDLDPDERRRLLGVIAGESRELGDLVAELVELATDPGAGHQPFTDVCLDEVVETVARQARDRTGRPVEVAVAPATVEGDAGRLERAVRNLVDNADKFSPPGTAIEVALSVADGVATVTVADHGPGIPTEDRERVFDRFYRSVATRTLPGSGLGLSIVADTVAAHGGRAWAGEADGGGALVAFTVPLAT